MWIFCLLFGLFWSAGCQSTGQGEELLTPAPELPAFVEEGISVEGRLVPKDSVQLSFVTGGQVAEVLVEEGGQVQAGETVARLANREPLEATIAAAEAELLAAQQAYDGLNEDLETVRTAALQRLNTARQAARDAEKRFRNLSGTADESDIDIAHTQVVFAENALEEAKEKFKRYENLPEDNLARARYRVVLAEAQKAYDQALRKYNGLVGTTDDFDYQQAQTDLEIANQELKLAQQEYDELQKGPDPDLLAAAGARLNTAKAQLASAQANLKNLELTTPVGGKIVELNMNPGEQVQAGLPVVLVADTSQWFVETDNLTELDVVVVKAGQKVKLVPDALPDLELLGEVVSVKDVFEEKRGDITYTVRILLEDPDPRLRWGMTVVATFE
jgi:multidrug resistance efflux pump